MAEKRKDTPKGANSNKQDNYKSILANLSKKSQNFAVLNHLLTNGSITTYEAFQSYGITRLSARIADLKELGVDISCEIVYKANNHYGIYRLEAE